MNIVYLQVDSRYNSWLLQTINNKYVIECTLDRIKKLNYASLIAGIYNCQENIALIEILRDEGVEVVLSEDEDVNSRFVRLVTKESAEYVIRVGGVRCFLMLRKQIKF